MTDWLVPFIRTFPSANVAVIRGEHPILIDTGFGSDTDDTLQLLQSVGVQPQSLQLIVNTHYHCDHVGGNHKLQTHFNLPIAAHPHEAKMVNSCDPETSSAEWLDQPIEHYRVTQFLEDGDEISTGEVTLTVIHTPGHTLGHISFYNSHDGTLICGDAVHADDVSWINPFRESRNAMALAAASLEKLRQLPLRRMFSGHSSVYDQPFEAIDSALQRYIRWEKDPEKFGWHATKRIFTYALMLYNGMVTEEVKPYLLSCEWFNDYSRGIFKTEPKDFVSPFVEELLRSKAAYWSNNTLYPTAPYRAPDLKWLKSVPRPANWNQ
jgi:hydroxyacylglutathione hydrolase